jgi:3-isopropylmalate dehydrogenase
MYGLQKTYLDILTDEASVISGSMGLMPSASLVSTLRYTNLFTVHTLKLGLNIAKCLTILSAAMMFEDALFNLQQ